MLGAVRRREPTDRKQRGSGLVEAALVMLTFLMLVLGIIDFGQMLYYHQVLVERARTAARYATTHPTETTGIQNMAVYNSASPSDTSTAVVNGLTTSMVSVVNSGNNTPEARVTVTISGYTINKLSPYITGTFTNRPIVVGVTAENQVP